MGLTLVCDLLVALATSFRVVGIYHPEFATNNNLFYTLVVLPQLAELCILCMPRLMARMSMAGRYEEWQAGGPPAPGSFTGSKQVQV